MKYVNFALDKLILIYEEVEVEDFTNVVNALETLDLNGCLTGYIYYIGKDIKNYKHNIRIGVPNKPDGAITIGYERHNSDFKDRHNLRVEFNPSKMDSRDRQVFRVLKEKANAKKYSFNSIDVAIDFPFDVRNVIIVTKTAKLEKTYGKNRYYGEKSSDGHLKCYDKKKEYTDKRKKDKLDEFPFEELARLEYTFKNEDTKNPLPLHMLKKPFFKVNDRYEVFLYDKEPKVKAELLCFLYGVLDKRITVNELSRTNKNKVLEVCKKHLPLIDMDEIIKKEFESKVYYVVCNLVYGTMDSKLIEKFNDSLTGNKKKFKMNVNNMKMKENK